jgi:putative Holliday junction resolvase
MLKLKKEYFMKILLGIDYGTKRIGIAIGNTSIGVAVPKDILIHDDHFFDKLQSIIDADEVTELVVGIPQSFSGQTNKQQQRVEEFITALQRHIALPIHRVNEVASTNIVRQQERKHGRRERGQRKTHDAYVDAKAAAVILQSYMDHV